MRSDPAQSGSSEEAVAEADTNPFKQADDDEADGKIVLVAAEQPEDATASTSQASPSTQHDAATLALIEKEMRNASPHEREELFNDLKGLEPQMVRLILNTRRMVRQIGQKSPARQSEQGSVTATSGINGQTPPGQPIGTDQSTVAVQGVGHSADQIPVEGSSRHAAGMGSKTPWGNSAENRPRATRFRSGDGPAAQYAAAAAGGKGAFDLPAGPGQARASYERFTSTAPPRAGLGESATSPAMRSGLPGSQYRSQNGVSSPAAPGAGTNFVGNGETNPATAVGSTSGAFAQGDASPQLGESFPGGSQDRGRDATVLMPPNFASETMDSKFSASPSEMNQVPNARNWRNNLEKLIALAEKSAAEAEAGANSSEESQQAYIEKQVYLRMLYQMADQPERTFEPIRGIEPADQEFWQQTLWAISNYFDTAAMPDSVDRATQTVAQLRTAIERLQETAKLELRNVSFCHKINSYGSYESFPRNEFSPGQPVLVYAEVNNFKSEPASNGQFRTILRSAIEIYRAGSDGELLERIPFQPTEDLCHNHRRDYFHSYEFTIPPRIGIGPHVMKLTVEDQLSQKIATYALNFTVK
jgi:hypothetical protein